MNDRFITDNNILLLRQRKKFNVDYFDAAMEKEGNMIYFPYFLSIPTLNSALFEIIKAYHGKFGNLDVKLLFANSEFISLSFKELYSLNFSLFYNSFLPSEMILKMYGIKKSYYKKVLLRTKKKYNVVEASLRCASDGIRVDVVDRKTQNKLPLKIRNTNKISQIT